VKGTLGSTERTGKTTKNKGNVSNILEAYPWLPITIPFNKYLKEPSVYTYVILLSWLKEYLSSLPLNVTSFLMWLFLTFVAFLTVHWAHLLISNFMSSCPY
jgi:hypothetical protein